MGKFLSLDDYESARSSNKTVKEDNVFENYINDLLKDNNYQEREHKIEEKYLANIFTTEYLPQITQKNSTDIIKKKFDEYFANRTAENLIETINYLNLNYSKIYIENLSSHIKEKVDKPNFDNCTLYEKTLECLDKLRNNR
jgi:hypothetical protein